MAQRAKVTAVQARGPEVKSPVHMKRTNLTIQGQRQDDCWGLLTANLALGAVEEPLQGTRQKGRSRTSDTLL